MDDNHANNHQELLRFTYGRLIWPLLIGILLILWGFSDLFRIDFWRYIEPTIAIIPGILIILGVIFGYRRK
jgi:hypothetical protein